MKAKTQKAPIEPIPLESTISTRAEEKQVEERLAIGANVVYETIRRQGDEELQRPHRPWRGQHWRRDCPWGFPSSLKPC